MPLNPVFGEHTINQLMLMYDHDQIKLNPGFQRRSVWTRRDRQRLIQSIVSGYPLPSIFLYQRHDGGRTVYDVIDGKQRLETILMFHGKLHGHRFSAKLDLGEGPSELDWKRICRKFPEVRARFDSYKIQTVEITGPLDEIIDLFVCINSTGKRLTSGEKRHARFFKSAFLKEANRLVRKHQQYLLAKRILSPAQLDRMKGTELFAELLMSMHFGGPINKKTSLDKAIGNDAVNGNTLGRLSREFVRTMGIVRRVVPELEQTPQHCRLLFTCDAVLGS